MSMGGEVIKMHKKVGQPKKGTTKMCVLAAFEEKNKNKFKGNLRIFSLEYFFYTTFSHGLP